MTRRGFLGAAILAAAPGPVVVPLRRIMDAHARCDPETLRRFWSDIWPEAVREFGRAGVQLQVEDAPGEIRHTAGDQPIFVGLRRRALNLVLTDHVPMNWDRGRALAGMTAIYDGQHISLIAIRYAHGNQAPYFSLNTVVHEMLHALMQDVFVRSPKWYQEAGRESGIDWHATRLWLFHGDAAVRESARAYVARLSRA